jgi:tetratricopeptide (TPR) repeat protein
MNIINKIKKLLQEAELYHAQGLLDEAMAKYNTATELIHRNEQLKSKQNLLQGISKKINALKKDISKIELAPKKPEVEENVQNLIKKMYSFSPDIDEDAKALEGGIALAKFGQFKRAISDFNELLKNDSTRVDAAKNIIRCHVAIYSIDDAISQYEKWLLDDVFLPNQLDKLCIFFESLLKSEGVEKRLPRTKEEVNKAKEMTPPENDQLQFSEQEYDELEGVESKIEADKMLTSPEGDQLQVSEQENAGVEEGESDIKADDTLDTLDVNSIGITLDSGPQKGHIFEFKVRFQLGKVVSLLIPSRDKNMIESFEVGSEVHNVQYYSNVGLFNGSGLVTSVKEITIGPLRGDYCVDIEVLIH